MSYTSVNRVGTDHSEWLKGLDFYKDELSLMSTRLSEVAMKNTSFESRQGVEHFQNQFILQRNNIDELRHEVKQYVHLVAKETQEHVGHVDAGTLAEKAVLQEKYDSLEKIIKDLRHEFNEYLAKWM